MLKVVCERKMACTIAVQDIQVKGSFLVYYVIYVIDIISNFYLGQVKESNFFNSRQSLLYNSISITEKKYIHIFI